MGDIDLTEAARAIRAAQASRTDDQARLARWWDEGFTSPEDVETVTRQARAALPHIERQVREQVAREIEAEAARRRRDADEYAAARGGTRDPHQDSIRAGFSLAARIARGEG